MYEPKMTLTDEERAILEGKEGKTKAKMMEVLVRYGDTFGADKLLPLTYKKGHFVTSFGISMLKPVYPLMDELIKSGLKAPEGFTMDPRPIDYKNCNAGPLEKLLFDHFVYGKQAFYEKQLKAIGMKNMEDFTCTCYLKEVGNTPKKGDVISWSESSAVVFANSVLGAHCNRNSGILDTFATILGKTPNFGFTTEEGRKATWEIVLNVTKLPEAQILGSAIGIKVQSEVPYVRGLDKFLKPLPDEDTIGYLKDFGAATASNGAVGLYHIEGITPDAIEKGDVLLKEDHKVYVIDDAELERVYKSYPVMWKKSNLKPHKAFIGCPHLTLKQLIDWTNRMEEGLKRSGKKKLVVYTVFTAAPKVGDAFEKLPEYKKFISFGAHLSFICPLMYVDNPVAGAKPIITNSNKLRTYSASRYFKDADILDIITGNKEVK